MSKKATPPAKNLRGVTRVAEEPGDAGFDARRWRRLLRQSWKRQLHQEDPKEGQSREQ